MLSPEQEELSAEELKSKLFHSFREKGVLDSLKSQLRNRLITELSHGGITGKIPRHVSVKDESLMLRASNSILADHLRRCHYDYTLSVFLPESGTGQDKLFTVRDLLQLLQINPQSKLFKDLSSSITTFTNESFLWQLLTQLASRYQGGCHDKSLQTEGPPVCFTSLDDKLDCVEQAYSNKLDNNELGGSLEERLMSHRRQIEAQARTDVNAEILRFKENDLARVKLEEREKARKEIEQSRKEMERTYQIKSDALGERERHSLERLQKEREIMEKETFIQRQKVLEELDSLRVREATVRREADLNAKAVKIEEDRRRAIEDNLRKREAAVARIEETYEHQLTEKMASYDLEQKSKYITRLQSLEISEARNKEETRLLAEERARVNLAREDLKEKTARCKQLEIELQKLKKDTLDMTKHNDIMSDKLREMADYPSVKEEAAVLRRELHNTKTALTEVKHELKIDRTKYEEQLRELRERLTKPTPEMVTLQVELNRTRDRLKDEETMLRQKETHLNSKLHEETEKCRDLKREVEEQTRQMNQMNEEITDLRATLRETQKALSNEVYRNPKSVPDSFYASKPLSRNAGQLDDLDSIDLCADTGFKYVSPDASLDLATPRERPRTDASLDLATPRERPRSASPDLALDKFLAETKARFQNLEMEAENLDENYRNYRHRSTNIYALPKKGSPSLKRSTWSDATDIPIRKTTSSSASQRKQSPPRSVLKKDRSAPSLSPSHSKPAGSVTIVEDGQVGKCKIVTSPTEKSSTSPLPSLRSKPLEVEPILSVSSPRRPLPKTGGYHSPSVKKDNNDLLLTGDAWKSSSLPHDVVEDEEKQEEQIEFSSAKSSPRLKKETSYDDDWESSKSERSEHQQPVVSLDAAWKHEVTSLDTEWKGQVKSEQELEKEREDERKWEEERKQKEEDRKRKEQEAWEREQRELEELERQQQLEKGDYQTSVTGQGSDEKVASGEEKKDEEGKTDKKNDDDSDANIDPVMKKYMQMVQKKKEEKKEQEKTASPDHSISIEEEIPSLGATSDNTFDDW